MVNELLLLCVAAYFALAVAGIALKGRAASVVVYAGSFAVAVTALRRGVSFWWASPDASTWCCRSGCRGSAPIFGWIC